MAPDGLTDADIEFIKELREAREDGSISRRQALGALAGLGIGGAAGALGTQTVTASDHNDSDGNVGLPGDRVDVFANDANAEELTGTYPGKVRAFSDGEVVASIDPSTTSTPLDDAQTAIDNETGVGSILLPPGTIQEGSEFDFGPNMRLFGWGKDISTVEFPTTGSSANGFRLNSNIGGGGFTIQGPGASQDTGHPMYSDSNVRHAVFSRDIEISEWSGIVHLAQGSANMWESYFSNLVFNNVDGGGDPLLDWRGGESNRIGSLVTIATDANSGVDSGIFRFIGTRISLGTVNGGGTLGPVSNGAVAYISASTVSADYINFEPIGQNSTADAAVMVDGGSTGSIGVLKVQGDADYAYKLRDVGGEYSLGPVEPSDVPNINYVDISSNANNGLVWYWGPASDIDNNAGTSKGNVRSLATAGTGNG